MSERTLTDEEILAVVERMTLSMERIVDALERVNENIGLTTNIVRKLVELQEMSPDNFSRLRKEVDSETTRRNTLI